MWSIWFNNYWDTSDFKNNLDFKIQTIVIFAFVPDCFQLCQNDNESEKWNTMCFCAWQSLPVFLFFLPLFANHPLKLLAEPRWNQPGVATYAKYQIWKPQICLVWIRDEQNMNGSGQEEEGKKTVVVQQHFSPDGIKEQKALCSDTNLLQDSYLKSQRPFKNWFFFAFFSLKTWFSFLSTVLVNGRWLTSKRSSKSPGGSGPNCQMTSVPKAIWQSLMRSSVGTATQRAGEDLITTKKKKFRRTPVITFFLPGIKITTQFTD